MFEAQEPGAPLAIVAVGVPDVTWMELAAKAEEAMRKGRRYFKGFT